MSLNLGNEVVSALAELRGNPSFEQFRHALGDRAYQLLNDAVDTPIDHRIELTAYARAVRDLWIALESGTTGVSQRTIKPPRPKRNETNEELL